MTGVQTCALPLSRDWLDGLRRAVPEIAGIIDQNIEFNGELMVHSIFADLFPWIEQPSDLQEADSMKRFLEYLEESYGSGSRYIDNAIDVSFIEDLGHSSPLISRLGPKLSDSARRIYPEILK